MKKFLLLFLPLFGMICSAVAQQKNVTWNCYLFGGRWGTLTRGNNICKRYHYRYNYRCEMESTLLQFLQEQRLLYFHI